MNYDEVKDLHDESKEIITSVGVDAEKLKVITIGKSPGKDFDKTYQELGWLAREIHQNPWGKEFAEELEVGVIFRVHRIMEENKNARNSWLKSERGKLAQVGGNGKRIALFIKN